jgi:hypothetical protein
MGRGGRQFTWMERDQTASVRRNAITKRRNGGKADIVDIFPAETDYARCVSRFMRDRLRIADRRLKIETISGKLTRLADHSAALYLDLEAVPAKRMTYELGHHAPEPG